VEITIRYNAERGFEDAALRFARRLFAELDEAITSLELIPVDDEDLAISVGGRLVYSTSRVGRLPRLADLELDPD
jgi:Rdx family